MFEGVIVWPTKLGTISNWPGLSVLVLSEVCVIARLFRLTTDSSMSSPSADDSDGANCRRPWVKEGPASAN